MPRSDPLFNFQDKAVLVTGAGRGIGRAVAVALYTQGATVFALSKNADNLRSLEEECPNIRSLCVDLSNWDETRELLQTKVERVDVLINNAAICVAGRFFEISPDNFDRMMNVNLKSVINVSQVISQKMIQSGRGGAIVNISSIAGRKAFPSTVAYSCTKAGLEMLTKAMAIELGPHKITVNSVCPAAVQTDMLRGVMNGTLTETKRNGDTQGLLKMIEEMTPTKTLYMPMADVVNMILFFASGATSQITGASVAVDGGIISV